MGFEIIRRRFYKAGKSGNIISVLTPKSELADGPPGEYLTDRLDLRSHPVYGETGRILFFFTWPIITPHTPTTGQGFAGAEIYAKGS